MMNPEDKFLKVEITAYFPVNELHIEKREYANEEDLNGIYLDGIRIEPDIIYDLNEISSDTGPLKKKTKPKVLIYDRASVHEEFVSREQIWKEDPLAQRIDELIEEHSSSISTPKI